MKHGLALFIGLLISTSSWATGSTFCSVDDGNVKMEVELNNARIFGSALLDHSKVVLKIKQSPTIGFTDYTFDKDSSINELPYWWNLGDELKLGAYAEPDSDENGNPIDAFITLSVVIDTKFVQSTNSYEGTYTVNQYANAPGLPTPMEEVVSGRITCTVE